MEDASSLLKSLKLVPHPEGGFFGLTYVDETEVPSPFAKNAPNRPVCSVIFYLLAPEGIKVQLDKDAKLPAKFRASAGYFHTNDSTTSHTWHSGKAVYTLIKRDKPADAVLPEIKTITLGPDASAGEQMQLIVPPGWWKASRLVDEGKGHCLITETVCPGWHPQEHEFMHDGHVKSLFGEDQVAIKRAGLQGNVLPEGHILEF